MKYLRIALLSCLASGTLNLQASQSPEKSPNKMNKEELKQHMKEQRQARAEKRNAEQASLTAEEKEAKRIDEHKTTQELIEDLQERSKIYKQELATLAQHQAERQAQKDAAQAEPKTSARVHFEQSSTQEQPAPSTKKHLPTIRYNQPETQEQPTVSGNASQSSPESQPKITRVPMMPSPSHNEPKKSLNEILKTTPVDSGASDNDSKSEQNDAVSETSSDSDESVTSTLQEERKAQFDANPTTINRVRYALGFDIVPLSEIEQNLKQLNEIEAELQDPNNQTEELQNALRNKKEIIETLASDSKHELHERSKTPPHETPFNGHSDEDEKARQLLWEMYQLDIQKLREERDSLIEQLKNKKLSVQDRKLLEAELVFKNNVIKDYEDDNKSAWQRLQETLQAIDKDIVSPALQIITLVPVYNFLVETEAEQQEATRGKFFEASEGMTAKQRFHFTKRTVYNHANAAFKNARNAVASLISMVIEQNS